MIKNKRASMSVSSDNYIALHNWPDESRLQCGGEAIFSIKSNEPTFAFFEAFVINTFIRGEGEFLIEAENEAWKKYEKILNCKHHHFIRDGENTRVGKCQKCNYKLSNYYSPNTKCSVCQKDHSNFLDVIISDETDYSAESYLCLNHFMEKTKKLNFKYIQKMLKENPKIDPFFMNYAVVFRGATLLVQELINNNIINEENKEEYKIADEAEKIKNKYGKFITQKIQYDLIDALNKEGINISLIDLMSQHIYIEEIKLYLLPYQVLNLLENIDKDNIMKNLGFISMDECNKQIKLKQNELFERVKKLKKGLIK